MRARPSRHHLLPQPLANISDLCVAPGRGGVVWSTPEWPSWAWWSGDVSLNGGGGGDGRDEEGGCGEERHDGAGGERGQPGRDLGHSVAAPGAGQGGGGGVGQVGGGGAGEGADELLDAECPEQDGDDGADLVSDERPDADPDRGKQA